MKKSIKYEGYVFAAIIIIILIVILAICYVIGEDERIKQADEYRANQSSLITRYAYENYNVILASVGKNDSYIYIKVLDEEENSVKNAILKLYNEEGIILAEKETSRSGITGFSGMKNGIYYVLETEVQSGYDLDETLYKIEITDDCRYFEFEIENTKNADYEEKTENNYFDTCDFEDIANKRDENLASSESIDISSKQIVTILTEIEPKEITEEDESKYFYRMGTEKLKDERIYLQTLETTEKVEDGETYYYTAFKLELDNYEIVKYEVSKLFTIADGVSVVDEDGNEIDTLESDDVFYLKYTETSKSTGYIKIEFTLKYDDNTRYSFTIIHEFELH